MIAVDASAILAILIGEPEARAFRDAILEAGGGLISTVNYWEVMARAKSAAGLEGCAAADDLLAALDIQLAPTTGAQALTAVDAMIRFGRGTRAALNLGDCFAYALAAAEGDGLLFKGDDFPHTDVVSALART